MPRSCMVQTRTRVAAAALLCALGLVAAVPTPPASAAVPASAAERHPSAVNGSEWPTFDQNQLRTGVDASGASFSSSALAWNSPELDGQLYGQPLIATGRVYASTENDTVYALAADTGSVLWSTHVGTAFDPSTVPGVCGNIVPTIGITSTPVIDTGRSEIFVVAAEAAPGTVAHHLVGLDIYTGAVLLDEVIDPAGTDPPFQLQRASLALTGGRVIVGFGGNAGDCGPYHGLVVAAPEDGSNPSTYTVATQPGDGQGAVWMGGAAPSIDAQGNVWVATGNGAYSNSSDPYDQSDGVLKLSPNMLLLDWFAPAQWYNDNAGDQDLGSTAPALLPNGLVFQVGKSTVGYVLDQSNLGHVGGQVASNPSFCFADGGSADLNGTLFVPCSGGVAAVKPTASTPTLFWQTASGAHSSPIVAGGLVWSIGGGTLYALDASNGHVVHQFSIGLSSSSFPSPSAADGLVFATGAQRVSAFDGPAGLPPPPSPSLPRPGYWLVASDGGIFSFGGASFFGSTGSLQLNQLVVGMAATPDQSGYWLVASDGGIFTYGDAGFFGSTGSMHLNQPIVDMAATATGRGYWLVASDGGVFAFGDAGFFGSTGSMHLNQPMVGMAATATGRGYWLVASDGGVFAFGDAVFQGSTGSDRLNRPIVGMAADPAGAGYWLVASDGGIFAFGAPFFGSTGSILLYRPVVGMAATPTGDGYWLVASDGGVFAFGDAVFEGSTGGSTLNQPIVGIAASAFSG